MKGAAASAAAVVLRAANTHLYPGARLAASAPLKRGARVTIEFADLGAAAARVERCGAGAATLAVEVHRTAAGTLVAARRWLLAAPDREGEESGSAWRVVRRLSDAAS